MRKIITALSIITLVGCGAANTKVKTNDSTKVDSVKVDSVKVDTLK